MSDNDGRVPAFRVEVSTYSGIVGHMIGWQRATDEDKTFGRRESAERYAEQRSGVISILVPYMFWRSKIVPVSMPADWRSPETRQLDLMTLGFGAALVAIIVATVFL